MSLGFLSELWDAVLEEAGRISGNTASGSSVAEANVHRSKRALEDGQYRKAIPALSSQGLTPGDDQTFQSFLDLHPQAPPSLPSSAAPPASVFSNSIVLAALDSFPQGSSSSPSGLRPSHLKEADLCPFPTHYFEFIGALTSFCQMASRGEVPADIVPFLCGATLIACLKKNGGIRPIAIGEFLRCLISKCLVSATLPEAVDCLSPHQLRVVFLVVLRLSSMLLTSTSHHLPCMLTTLLLDFSNAFNYIKST